MALSQAMLGFLGEKQYAASCRGNEKCTGVLNKKHGRPDIDHVRALPCLFRDIVEPADACDRCKDTK